MQPCGQQFYPKHCANLLVNSLLQRQFAVHDCIWQNGMWQETTQHSQIGKKNRFCKHLDLFCMCMVNKARKTIPCSLKSSIFDWIPFFSHFIKKFCANQSNKWVTIACINILLHWARLQYCWWCVSWNSLLWTAWASFIVDWWSKW